MAIKLTAFIAPAVAFVLVSALAGCAPASTPTPGRGSASPAAPSAAPSGSSKSSSALTGLPTNCPGAGLVSSDLGISTAEVGHSGDSTSLNCAYAGNNVSDSVSINFSTVRQLSPSEAETQTKAQGFTPAFAKVRGLGDFAFYDRISAGGSYIIVASGPVAFHIVATGDESKQQLESLATAIL